MDGQRKPFTRERDLGVMHSDMPSAPASGRMQVYLTSFRDCQYQFDE